MSDQLSAKDYHFLLQGVRALQKETRVQKGAALERMFPADNNLQSLVEYYDKRQVELHGLEMKIQGIISP